MGTSNGIRNAPILIPTLEGSSITIDSIAIIQDLDRALDPYSPPHQATAVVTIAGPIVRVRADELRKIFGTRRRPNAPLPIGGFRPPRNPTK